VAACTAVALQFIIGPSPVTEADGMPSPFLEFISCSLITVLAGRECAGVAPFFVFAIDRTELYLRCVLTCVLPLKVSVSTSRRVCLDGITADERRNPSGHRPRSLHARRAARPRFTPPFAPRFGAAAISAPHSHPRRPVPGRSIQRPSASNCPCPRLDIWLLELPRAGATRFSFRLTPKTILTVPVSRTHSR